MKKEKFLKIFYALLLLVAGMSFAACSEEVVTDDDDPAVENPEEEESSSKYGDDFYMAVNGAWHDSIGTVEQSKGFMFDAMASVEKKSASVLESMDEYVTIMNSYEQLMAGGIEANLEFTDSIIQSISERVVLAESKEELGEIVGECVMNGYVDCLLRLYAAVPKDDSAIGYTLAPDPVMASIMSAGGEEEGEEEEDGEEEEARLMSKHLNLGSFKKYTSMMTRTGGDNFMSGVVNGLDLDPEHFLVEDSMATVYMSFEESTLEELKECVLQALVTELYIYCGDEKTQEVTDNAIGSTSQILKQQLPHLLAYPLSYYFCKQYVNDEVKAEYTEYAETMRSVFASRIAANAWLSESTKQAALNKLASMKFFIGEPDSWNTESFPNLRGELLAEDILETKQSRNNTIISMLGKNKREESMNMCIVAFGGMTLNVYNACYVHETNAMLILPAFMMEPEYTSDMDAADKYALFYVIGHEMTHGFDRAGSKYDAEGNLNNWWADADRAQFEALNDALAQQISTFEAAPGIMTDGNRTITEDVADLGGMNIAFDALNLHLVAQGLSAEEIEEAQKAFFIRHAYRYRSEYSLLQLQHLLGDVHSVATIRVNGMVQHMDKWYDLFDVKEGEGLYLPAEERITIW